MFKGQLLGCPFYLLCWLLSQGCFNAPGQLVCAGGSFAAAVVAFEHINNILGIGSFQQLCDSFGVARAATLELDVIYLAVLE